MTILRCCFDKPMTCAYIYNVVKSISYYVYMYIHSPYIPIVVGIFLSTLIGETPRVNIRWLIP